MLYVSMPHSRHRLSSSLAHQPVSGVQFGMSFVRVVLPGSPYPPAMSLCVSWLCSVAGHSPSPSASVAAAAGCVVVLFFCLSSKKEEAAAAESKSGRQNGQRQPHSEFSPSPFRLNHNNNHNTNTNHTSRSSDSSGSGSQVFSFRPPC